MKDKEINHRNNVVTISADKDVKPYGTKVPIMLNIIPNVFLKKNTTVTAVQCSCREKFYNFFKRKYGCTI